MVSAPDLKPKPLRELLADVELASEGSLGAQVYALLWDLIVTVQLPPGQPLSENEVADLLKASKTPVREAFIRLQDNGLVEVVPKSGTYVSPIRVNRFIEATFIRLRLETGAVVRAAEHHADFASQIRLESCIHEQKAALKAKDYLEFFELDEKFHRAIFAMAGLPGAWETMRQTQSEFYRVRHLRRLLEIRRTERVLDHHVAIAKAIREGDAAKAERAMSMHLGSVENKVDELSARPEILAFIEELNGSRGRSSMRGNAMRRTA